MPRRPLLARACLVACMPLLAACGGSDASPSSSAAEPSTTDVVARAAAAACTPPDAAVPRGTPTGLVRARRRLDAAVVDATERGHRFATSLGFGRRRAIPTATLTGRRTPDGASIGTLELVGDVGLRIVDDRLYARGGLVGSRGWRDLGSASGVAIDVGRELLAHPFLLRATAARRVGSSTFVTLDAPADELRAYATAERRGPVTELLARARSLRITAELDEGRLVGDRFRLVTTAPAGLPLVRAGARVTITGSTRYCPLRARDRTVIAAPRLSSR